MRINLVKFLNFLFLLYIPIDCINGLIIRSTDISISSIFKTLILILLIKFFFDKKIYKPLYFFIVFLIFYFIRSFSLTSSSLDFMWGIKFISIVFSYFYFRYLVTNRDYKILFYLAYSSFFIIVFNVFVGSLGYGYQQYSREGIGTRGFFYAGNELGVLLISTCFIILSKYNVENNHFKFYVYSLVAIVCSSFLTTKSSILGVVILVTVIPLINFKFNLSELKLSRSSFKFLLFSSFILFFVFPLFVYFILFELDLISRLSTYYYRFDIFTLIFSGRDLALNEVTELYNNMASAYNLYFGVGFDWLLNNLGHSVELDFVDFFLIFGILGLIWIFICLKYIYSDIKILNFKLFPFKKLVLFFFFFLLVLSSLSGHVFNSGLAGYMIGLCFSLSHIQYSIK